MHNDGRFDYHNALRYSSDELAKILSHCFENYIVRFVLDGPTFAARFGAEDISLNDSLIVTHRHEPVAVALIARRGQHSRVAAFPCARRCAAGAGQGADAAAGGGCPPARRPTAVAGSDRRQRSRAGAVSSRRAAHRAHPDRPSGAGGSAAGTTAGLQAVDPLTVSHRLTAEGATDLPG